jgi:hypothetical protein
METHSPTTMGATKYDDYDWDELPADIKAAAELLGYTKKLWDGSKTPSQCDEDWTDLSGEMQEAAKKLGYDKASWDKS